jgi:hypothetical protein
VSTTPGEPAGVVAVIDVALLTVYELALTPPNWTALAPLTPSKLVPLTVTDVPPPEGPAMGETDPTVGAEYGVPETTYMCPLDAAIATQRSADTQET